MEKFDYHDETMIVVEEPCDKHGLNDTIVGYDKLSHLFFTVRRYLTRYDHDFIEPVYEYNIVSHNRYYEITGYEYPEANSNSEAVEVFRAPGSLHYQIDNVSRVEPYRATIIPQNHGCLVIAPGTNEIFFGQYLNRSDLLKISIPLGVKRIGAYAFYCCERITEIFLPESVDEIGAYAFSLCSSLTSVTLPNHAIKVRMHAFSGCNSLTDVYMSAEYSDTDLLDPKTHNFSDAWPCDFDAKIVRFHIMNGKNELYCLTREKAHGLHTAVLTKQSRD